MPKSLKKSFLLQKRQFLRDWRLWVLSLKISRTCCFCFLYLQNCLFGDIRRHSATFGDIRRHSATFPVSPKINTVPQQMSVVRLRRKLRVSFFLIESLYVSVSSVLFGSFPLIISISKNCQKRKRQRVSRKALNGDSKFLLVLRWEAPLSGHHAQRAVKQRATAHQRHLSGKQKVTPRWRCLRFWA